MVAFAGATVALRRYRAPAIQPSSPAPVTIGEVTVNGGGQAIVGAVSARSRSDAAGR